MKKIKKIKIKINGKIKTINDQFTLAKLMTELKIPLNKVAIELNKEIVNKKKINKIKFKNKDVIEIVHFIGGGWSLSDKLVVAKKRFNSRLIVGTGKYKNMSECAKAIKLSGANIVTVAVRRVNISDKSKPLL